MIKKTYKSKSVVSVTVQIDNGLSAYISFAPQIDGSGLFTTTSAALQSALEAHPKYETLFELDSSESVMSDVTEPKVSYSYSQGAAGNVVMFTPQELTEQEKQQARQNIGAATEAAELENVLRYSAQILTEEQKKQARTNIGVGDYPEVITNEEMAEVLS